MHRIYNIFKIV